MKYRGFLLGICLAYSVFGVAIPKLQALEVRFSSQNAYVSWPELSTSAPQPGVAPAASAVAPATSGINNRVWTMNGSALHASKGDSVEAFLSYSESQIRDRLKSYLREHPALNPQTDDLIIVDMEHPVHPKKRREYSGTKQTEIIEAFKKRIKIARQEFPNAKLSLYGVIVSDGRGDPSRPGFKEMVEAYKRAGQLGMYDDLDYLTPILHLRFGPQDKQYNTIEAYTRLALETTHSLQTSQGTALPLVPELSFKIYNGGSRQHRQCAPVEPIQKQMKIIQEYPYVQMIVLWAGPAVIKECTPQKFLKSLASQIAN
jgi:hypothetical protein